ncbi:MAG TPA: class I SAM-dependent methyltransferase [Tepidisphaeraceae bacterium]|nr:class I SAM-dependent methyltransferase [Tepidisphaeraceae bacterium]
MPSDQGEKFIRTFAGTDNSCMRCWCGNERLIEWGEGYHRCDACQTLVAAITDRQADPRVIDDRADLYGRDYWFDHQTRELNCPDIITRSRTDLSDRCIHWLRTLLQFKLPPARVLEIGCAHGGFVAMLHQSGFDATGLELSPSIVEYARQTFDVPVLSGPIEDQTIAAGTLDAVILMDVMEHLPQPQATLRRCLDLLKSDGVLLIQTPSYPEGATLPELRAIGHKFSMMLDPNEHLFLFSPTAARKLFQQLDAEHIEFVPAIFGFYDMSFVVSRQSIARTTPSERDAALTATLPGRFMQAMLDLDERRLNLLRLYRERAA